MRNSYYLRVALLADLFTRVLPLPLPPDSPEARAGRCLWAPGAAGGGVRHETQAALLHALGLAARHLACACLSVRATRALDAARCVAHCVPRVARPPRMQPLSSRRKPSSLLRQPLSLTQPLSSLT